MQKVFNWLTKEKIMIISGAGVLLNIFSRSTVKLGICESYSGACGDYSYVLVIFSYLFVPIFVFSLITLVFKNNTFIIWRRFSILWIMFSFALISVMPTYTHGLDFMPITKGSVTLFLLFVYSLVSIAIITVSAFKKEKGDTILP